MDQNGKPDNLVEMIEASVAAFADHPLFGTKNPKGEYEWATYREVGERIDHLRGGLARAGVGRGDWVGIIADNRAEWAIAAFAAYGLGARFVPMYEKELPRIWQYIIQDSGIKVLLVAKPEIQDQVEEFRDTLPGLEGTYRIDGEGNSSMAELERIGRDHPVPSIHPSPEDIAVLIYTSGTTGNPKGVILSHGNLTSNYLAGQQLFPNEMTSESVSLSILPWAHSYGQTAELYNFCSLGGAIGFVESVDTVAEDMAKVRPTFLIAVPRVFNKIYDRLWARMEETGGLPKKLFVMGVEAGKKRRALAAEGKSDFLTHLKFGLADKVVFKKIRERFGGRLQGSLTASATMNVAIGYFFEDVGIPVYDAFGLTETAPAVTMNCPAAHRPGSVGRPIPGVRVEIDPTVVEETSQDGEIVVYGPNVMQGYHNNPDATRAVMTEDGGFRTGDRGRLDPDGYLFITGRLKEQYKLENGKYVFPAILEEEIKLSPWVEHAMIFGEGRPFNICVVVPDSVVLMRYAKSRGLPEDPGALLERPEIREMITESITRMLHGKFGGYEVPKKFIFSTEPFSLDNGLLTQTMKLKRRKVVEKFQEEIEAVFSN